MFHSIQYKVLIFTHIPSPYQVEFFNSIANQSNLRITVVYLHSYPKARGWLLPNIHHKYFSLDKERGNFNSVKDSVNDSDLVIFNYYQAKPLIELMQYCAKSGKQWCFWGERPGFRQLSVLGKLYRKWKLAVLHRQNVPIWGIGTWAVDQYRREFGDNRYYHNLPYFSDLERFSSLNKQTSKNKNLRFLYSGSLSRRKGIDLLTDAFINLANEVQNVHLDIMGEGVLYPSIEKKLQKYKDKVKFHGFQSWEKLHHFYQQADILCVPSRYDGWGLVVPEGLASGLLVISTDKTGAAIEFLKTGENGWLIPHDDAKALYGAMKQATHLTTSELSERSLLARASTADHTLLNGVLQFECCVQNTISMSI